MPNLKRNSAILLAIFIQYGAGAQTLVSFGKNKVSRAEFLQAYQKNNTDTSGGTISPAEYLELYTKFKLKVQDALDSGLDTTASQKNELQAFRLQLAENYMKEDASIALLVNEALERSKQDIRIAVDGKTLGWVTAFVLPYTVENIVYSTPVGQTATFEGETGTHNIKIIDKRNAVGEVRIAQILLAFRPDAGETEKLKLSLRADSLFNALQNGANFDSLVIRFSDDNLSYANRGEIPPFGVGKYDTTFENAAFALAKDGDISRPVKTDFGFHILKRIERIPFKEDITLIREKVLSSDRMQVAQAVFMKNIKAKISNDASSEDLANDAAVLDYYRNHIEKYNEEFAWQLEEFRQGNLLFAIMQQKVWDKSSTDSIGLLNYYHSHKSKYNWNKSADALIVTVLNNNKEADDFQQEITDNFSQWRRWMEDSNGAIIADSGRFELGQIPVVDRTNFTPGLITAPVLNEQDSTQTFSYIIRLHDEKESKTFEEARGEVINDYQQYLEEQWVAALRKKYPVKINKKVLKSL